MYYAAKNFCVTGWVRNRNDGSVEAVVEGTPTAVVEFIDWAHKGPGMCRVDSVDVTDTDGSFSSFEIKPTV